MGNKLISFFSKPRHDSRYFGIWNDFFPKSSVNHFSWWAFRVPCGKALSTLILYFVSISIRRKQICIKLQRQFFELAKMWNKLWIFHHSFLFATPWDVVDSFDLRRWYAYVKQQDVTIKLQTAILTFVKFCCIKIININELFILIIFISNNNVQKLN